MKLMTSIIFVPAVVISLAVGVLGDYLVKRRGLKFGRRSVAMTALGLNCLMFLTEATTQSDAVLITCLLTGFGCQLVFGAAAFGVCIDVGGNHAGAVSGLMNCIGQIGAFFLAIVFGKIVDSTHSYNAPLFVIAALMGIGSLLWLSVDPTKKLVAE